MSRPSELNFLDMLRHAAAAWRPYRNLAVGIVAVLVLQQLFSTGLAVSLKLIIDDVLIGGGVSLPLIIGGLAIGYALAAGATLLGEYLSSVATARIANNVRRRMFAHLQELSIGFFARAPMGELLSRFSNDLAVLRDGLVRRLVSGGHAVVGLSLNLPVLLYLEWRLALLTFVLVPLMGAAGSRLIPAAARATYELQRAEAATLNTVQENIRSQPVVKAFVLDQKACRNFDEELDQLEKTAVRAGFLISQVGSASTLGVQFVQLAITALGAYLAQSGELSAGSLVAFLSLLQLVGRDSIELTKRVIPALVTASGGVARIDELLAEPVRVSDLPDAVAAPPLNKCLELNDVHFSHDGVHPTLTAISLRIDSGQSVAFVGPSGSGKSTLIGLIMRLYEPDQGAVTVDGQNICLTKQSSLRRYMGVVFQDTFLFNTSILENIRLARPDAMDEEVEAAARAAEIHDFLISLPHGYRTIAGEGGARLSGGQRQRVAIARALLRNPSLLLLDEATSALDPRIESAINETLGRAAEGRTAINVTHRLASVQNADCIFVFEGGKLAESGTHEELLERGGIYHEMWQKQTGLAVSADGRNATINADRLRRIDLFEPLPNEALDALAAQFVPERFKPGETVFCQGDPGDRFYVVVRGKLEVIVSAPDRNEHTIVRLVDGDIFGEMALLDDAPRNATVRACMPTLTISLDRQQFNALLAGSDELQRRVRAVAETRRMIA